DYDLEVYNVDAARLRELLLEFGPVNTVGESFAVYKMVFRDSPPAGASEAGAGNSVSRFEIDVSLPRRESKSGLGHRGFTIEGDPDMKVEEAARRRDFTINAILYDPLENKLLDPFDGRRDLEHKILRAVDGRTFADDSLRVLRAVQLAARFELKIEPH